MNDYQICTQCIMDTTDPKITFDEEGVCSHCHYFRDVRSPGWDRSPEALSRLDSLIADLKARREGEQYDCMIGLSGGVDSSYLAYFLSHRYDLRILAVHVDGGWNSPQAVSNIENIVKSLNLDLYTHVVDWEEMKSVQVAFLRSETVNQDTPQDHAYFAALNEVAKKFKIHDFLVGYNLQTESILPKSWQGTPALDSVHFNYICRKFGGFSTTRFPRVSFLDQHFYYPLIYRLNKLSPLNFIKYNKEEAKRIIINELGWKDYGVKHGESKFTKFFQSYYLPKKYGYDKRRAHISSLVLAGEITREKGLELIQLPLYKNELETQLDLEYVAKKLDLAPVELSKLCEPSSTNLTRNYPTEEKYVSIGRALKRFLRL